MPVLKNPFTNANSPTPTIESTRQLAAFLHQGQKDHSGYDYIHHPNRVAQNLLRIAPDAEDDVIFAALLHDTIEDCNITAEDLEAWGYSKNCIAMIEAVTKPDNDKRPYHQVIDDLIASGNKGAMLVKIADNMDNLHPARTAELRAINPQKSERLQMRYIFSIKKLSAALGYDEYKIFDTINNAQPIGLNATQDLRL